jgi:hypothetical protein
MSSTVASMCDGSTSMYLGILYSIRPSKRMCTHSYWTVEVSTVFAEVLFMGELFIVDVVGVRLVVVASTTFSSRKLLTAWLSARHSTLFPSNSYVNRKVDKLLAIACHWDLCLTVSATDYCRHVHRNNLQDNDVSLTLSRPHRFARFLQSPWLRTYWTALVTNTRWVVSFALPKVPVAKLAS